MFMCFY